MTGNKKIAMFGGAAALALAVGFGGVGVGALGGTPAPTHAAPSVAAAHANPAPNVHNATLAGCIAGLDC
jgi:hypothetical protein